jgi:hypothetical protein
VIHQKVDLLSVTVTFQQSWIQSSTSRHAWLGSLAKGKVPYDAFRPWGPVDCGLARHYIFCTDDSLKEGLEKWDDGHDWSERLRQTAAEERTRWVWQIHVNGFYYIVIGYLKG